MKVVSVINYKGGVGKTTLTANLGAYVASKNRRVLLVDIDPQTHLTFNFVSTEDWRKNIQGTKTMRNFFQPVIDTGTDPRPLEDIIIPVQAENYAVGLVSSHLNLIETEIQLSSMVNVTSPKLYSSTMLKSLTYIKKALQKIQDKYDLVLIDCPPSFSIMVRNALIASDYYLIPTRLDYMSMLGIENLQRSLLKLITDYKERIETLQSEEYEPVHLEILGVVPTMVNYSKEDKMYSVHEEYRQELGKKYHLLKALRYNSSIFGVAPKVGMPIVLTKPKLFFQKTQKKVVEELQELGEEFFKLLDL